jgi:hypothetical protein
MNRILASLVTIALLATLSSFAADKKTTKREAGPNGGRLITAVEPHLEFLVTPERKVEISAVADGKVAPLSGQVISVTAGDRAKPTKMEFKEEGGKLVSTNTLPSGDGYPVSVSIKPGASGKATFEKFNLELSKCPSCKYAEYACTCEHSH